MRVETLLAAVTRILTIVSWPGHCQVGSKLRSFSSSSSINSAKLWQHVIRKVRLFVSSNNYNYTRWWHTHLLLQWSSYFEMFVVYLMKVYSVDCGVGCGCWDAPSLWHVISTNITDQLPSSTTSEKIKQCNKIIQHLPSKLPVMIPDDSLQLSVEIAVWETDHKTLTIILLIIFINH